MWLLKLAWKNLWRNKNRTAITISAIFFAVILSTVTGSLQDGVFDNLIRNMVSYYTGYIQVHRSGYWDERILDNSFELSEQVERSISDNENVAALTPRLESFALASSEELTRGCMVIGVDPDKENEITELNTRVVRGDYLAASDNAVLLSEGLGKRLGLDVNDTIILIGQGYHGAMAVGKFVVKGILHFGSPSLNDQSLFLPLSAAQELYSAQGLITSYVLSMSSVGLLNETASSISASLGNTYEVMTWEEMMPDVVQHIKTDKASMYIISVILYLLICFGIFGTLLMMMVERKYEMGMLVAIGMKKIKLIRLMLVESVVTVLLGCILGIVVSVPIVYYLSEYPIRFSGELAEVYTQFGFEPIFPASVDPQIFLTQGLIVISLGLLLSFYPIVKIIQLSPVKALKK